MAKAPQNSRPFSLLFILLFAVLPLIYVQSIVDDTLVPRQLFASVVLAAMAGMIWRIKTKEVFMWPVMLMYAGFLLMNFISVSAAINPVESWAVISRFLVGFSFLSISIFLLKSKRLSAENLVKSIVLFGGITALITLVNLLQALGSGDFVSDIYSVSGTFGHKNLLSSALMLSFPFAVMGAVVIKSSSWRKGSLILALLLVAEMFVLRTRGVWVSMFAGTLVTLIAFLAIRKKEGQKINLPLKWIGVGAGLAIVILVGLFLTKGFRENIGDRTNLERRIVFWQNSFEMIKEHPLTGVGAGNWRINFPKYGLSAPAQENSAYRLDQSVYQGVTHIQRPHNDYLWVWSESGPLGLLFFLGIFAAAIFKIAHNLRRYENVQDMSLDLMSLFGIVAYLSFSLTDFPLERTSHSLLIMSLVAIPHRKAVALPKWKLSTSTMAPVLLVALGFSVVVCAYRWNGEKYTVEVLDANRTRNARQIIPAVDNAVNSFYNMDYYANPLRYYSSIGKLVLKDVNGAFEDAQSALDVHPYNIIALNQMGNVYKAKGNMEQALEYYQKAISISAWFESARLNVAEIYVKKKDAIKAMEALALVPRSSRNPKYLDLLSKVLPQLVQEYPNHPKYKLLVDYLRRKNPKTREEYVHHFLQFRLPQSEPDAQ